MINTQRYSIILKREKKEEERQMKEERETEKKIASIFSKGHQLFFKITIFV
jgi:hypothetical protein